jgi:hypothetical protein
LKLFDKGGLRNAPADLGRDREREREIGKYGTDDPENILVERECKVVEGHKRRSARDLASGFD